MEKLLLRQVAPLRPSGLPAWAALLFGLALSFWASQGVRENIQAAEEARFLLHVRDAETAMRRQLWLYEQPLRAAAGLFKAGAVITPESWRQHAPGLLADINVPAVRSLGYATYGTQNDAPGGEPVPRARVLFTIPAGAPPEQGFDLLVHPGTRSALFHARDDGTAALSQRLDDSTGSPAHLLMAWPVYLGGPPPRNADARRRIMGWTFAILDAPAVLRGCTARPRPQHRRCHPRWPRSQCLHTHLW
jgi:CHASE domain